MDAISRMVEANVALGQRITDARGWTGDLAVVAGDKRHPSGFSQDFVDFCKANGFADADFLKPGRAGFGGFTEAHVPSKKPAIVLVHGNGCDATAMAPLIRELLAQGYAPQDIYAVSYGRGDPNAVGEETHSPKYARNVRDFLEAVQKYSKRPLVVVGHSKGVTDSQLAIHGVSIDATGAVRQFAEKLPVQMFIGAAGANQGLTQCRDMPFATSSNLYNGFHPDAKLFTVLPRLSKVANRVFSIVARDDELLNDELESARVPHEDGRVTLGSGGHMAPIWEPKELVALIKGQNAHVQRETASAKDASTDRWNDGEHRQRAATEAFFTGTSDLTEATFAAARGDASSSLMLASVGFATLAHAMQTAMTLPMMSFGSDSTEPKRDKI